VRDSRFAQNLKEDRPEGWAAAYREDPTSRINFYARLDNFNDNQKQREKRGERDRHEERIRNIAL